MNFQFYFYLKFGWKNENDAPIWQKSVHKKWKDKKTIS